MNQRDLPVGTEVERVTRYGEGLVKGRPGVVLKHGQSGVLVRYHDNAFEEYVSPNKLRLAGTPGVVKALLAAGAVPTATAPVPGTPTSPQKPEEKTMKTPTTPTVPSTSSAPAEPAPSAIDTLVKQGFDPVTVWLSMGAELVVRLHREVVRCEEVVAKSDEVVESARALLREAEADATQARNALRQALAAKEDLERRSSLQTSK